MTCWFVSCYWEPQGPPYLTHNLKAGQWMYIDKYIMSYYDWWNHLEHLLLQLSDYADCINGIVYLLWLKTVLLPHSSTWAPGGGHGSWTVLEIKGFPWTWSTTGSSICCRPFFPPVFTMGWGSSSLTKGSITPCTTSNQSIGMWSFSFSPYCSVSHLLQRDTLVCFVQLVGVKQHSWVTVLVELHAVRKRQLYCVYIVVALLQCPQSSLFNI